MAKNQPSVMKMTNIISDQTMIYKKTNVFNLHVECHLCGICHQSQTISLVISFDIALFVCSLYITFSEYLIDFVHSEICVQWQYDIF